jgi:hypothetical protein
MRSFGRSCRGQGKVFVKLVRQTAHPLLEVGNDLPTLAQQAHTCLDTATTLREPQRERLREDLTTAMRHHEHIRQQSPFLTQGKTLRHGKVVNAYDPTIAPMLKGKSNCPAQCGRKPGIISEPATGFLFANLTPQGNPNDASDVLPFIDKVMQATARVPHGPQRAIHSLAGDLGVNDPVVRQALHERHILSVGIPKTVEPITPDPRAEEILAILQEANLQRKRTPYQVQRACASGYSRPVVESHIATLLARGAGTVRYKGLAGAVVQQGMTVLSYNGAVLVRIRQRKLTKRAQKFRRLLGLKYPKASKINEEKN